jgi:hypothetical protein
MRCTLAVLIGLLSACGSVSKQSPNPPVSRGLTLTHSIHGTLWLLSGRTAFTAQLYQATGTTVQPFTFGPPQGGLSAITAASGRFMVAAPLLPAGDAIYEVTTTGRLQPVPGLSNRHAVSPQLDPTGRWVMYTVPVPHRISPQQVDYTFEVRVRDLTSTSDRLVVASTDEVTGLGWLSASVIVVFDHPNQAKTGALETLTLDGRVRSQLPIDYGYPDVVVAPSEVAVGTPQGTSMYDPASWTKQRELPGWQPRCWSPDQQLVVTREHQLSTWVSGTPIPLVTGGGVFDNCAWTS